MWCKLYLQSNIHGDIVHTNTDIICVEYRLYSDHERLASEEVRIELYLLLIRDFASNNFTLQLHKLWDSHTLVNLFIRLSYNLLLDKSRVSLLKTALKG